MKTTDTLKKRQQTDISLFGVYRAGVISILIGFIVILLLNLATPLDYVLEQIRLMSRGDARSGTEILRLRLGTLFLLFAVSCLIFILGARMALSPVRTCLDLQAKGRDIPDKEIHKARQRLLNLPFIISPIMLGFWFLFPMAMMGVMVHLGLIEISIGMTFAARAFMIGMIASAIVFFRLETYTRKALVPHFFPQGELYRVDGAARLSISRRIQNFYRLAGSVPMVIICLTLFISFWQADPSTVSVKDYGRGTFVFSLVVFLVFFLGNNTLNHLITRSIADPINDILKVILEVRRGNFKARVPVVSNDEIGVLGDATNHMIRGLEERELLRDAFGKYVSPEIRDEIISGRIPLDGETKEVSVLFADLRDFTPMAESQDPKRVVRILNDYFKEMGEAISSRSGLILQFVGDEIYAVFGAPITHDAHADQAFEAALEMNRRLDALNQAFSRQGRPCLAHGISIHSGPVVAANIGTPQRLSYLLVGDTVNLASRLQGLSRSLRSPLVISAETANRLTRANLATFALQTQKTVKVKGHKLPVDIHYLKSGANR